MNELLDVSAEEARQVVGGSVAGNLVDVVNGTATGRNPGGEFLKPPKHHTGGRFMLDFAGHNVGYLN